MVDYRPNDAMYSSVDRPQNQTQKTIRHVNKFSRTLRRRLTQRTIYEAKALKQQGINIIQALVQMTDLVGTHEPTIYN